MTFLVLVPIVALFVAFAAYQVITTNRLRQEIEELRAWVSTLSARLDAESAPTPTVLEVPSSGEVPGVQPPMPMPGSAAPGFAGAFGAPGAAMPAMSPAMQPAVPAAQVSMPATAAASFSQQPAPAPGRTPLHPSPDQVASGALATPAKATPGAPVPPVGATSGVPAPPSFASPWTSFPAPARAAASSSQSSFENVLGKNVLGIVASILVFLGIVFLGVLVVPYLGDGFRCALMYLVSLAFLVLGFVLSLRRRSPLSLAVLGTGAGALFISVLMTRMHFGFLGELETFALLLAWVAACMALVKRFDSLLLSIVAHVGMIVSVCFAYAAGFDDARALTVIVYQLLASAFIVGGSVLCFRRTYRFGLFASLGLTVVASLFMWNRFGATLSLGFDSSLPDAAIVAAFLLQFAAASALSFFLSVSASRLEDSTARIAVHAGSFVLWVAALFANVYWTVWKCAAQVPYPSAVDRVLDGLDVAPGIYHVAGGLDMAVAASVLCLVLYAGLMLFSYVKLGFDARLGKASVMACAGIAAGLMLWRCIVPLAAPLDGIPRLSFLLVLAVALYALAYALHDAGYGTAGNVMLGLEMFYLLIGGYEELAQVNAFLDICALLLVLGALLWWWNGLPQPNRSRRALPAALAGLVFFEFSVAWFAGREFPQMSEAITSFVLVVVVLALALAGFERLSQEGSGWRAAARVNELTVLFVAAIAIDSGNIGVFGVRPPLFIALYLAVTALALAVVVLRIYAFSRPGAWAPPVLQVVTGIAFTALCLAAVDGSTFLFEVDYAVSVLCMLCALACVTAGFVLRLKPLRLYGLVVTVLCVLKLGVVDVASALPLARVVAFIVGGVICFAISALYNYATKRFNGDAARPVERTHSADAE